MSTRPPAPLVVDLTTAAGLVMSGLAPNLAFPTLLHHPGANWVHADASHIDFPDSALALPAVTWEDYLHSWDPKLAGESFSGRKLCPSCSHLPVDLARILGTDDETTTHGVLFWAQRIGLLSVGLRHPHGWVTGGALRWNVPRELGLENGTDAPLVVQRLRELASTLFFEVAEKRRAGGIAHIAELGIDVHETFVDGAVEEFLQRLGSTAPAGDDWFYAQFPGGVRPVDTVEFPAVRCGTGRLISGAALLRHLSSEVANDDRRYGAKALLLRWIRITEPVTATTLARVDRTLDLAESLGLVGDVTDVDHTLYDLVAS